MDLKLQKEKGFCYLLFSIFCHSPKTFKIPLTSIDTLKLGLFGRTTQIWSCRNKWRKHIDANVRLNKAKYLSFSIKTKNNCRNILFQKYLLFSWFQHYFANINKTTQNKTVYLVTQSLLFGSVHRVIPGCSVD